MYDGWRKESYNETGIRSLPQYADRGLIAVCPPGGGHAYCGAPAGLGHARQRTAPGQIWPAGWAWLVRSKRSNLDLCGSARSEGTGQLRGPGTGSPGKLRALTMV